MTWVAGTRTLGGSLFFFSTIADYTSFYAGLLTCTAIVDVATTAVGAFLAAGFGSREEFVAEDSRQQQKEELVLPIVLTSTTKEEEK